MRIFSSFRRSIATVSLFALLSQTILPGFVFAADPTMSSTLVQANVPPEAQVVTLTVPRDLNPGDSLVFTLSGSVVTQSFDTSSAVTLGLMNVKIDALPEVTSSLNAGSRTYTVTSANPGTGFATPTLVTQASANNFNTLVNNVVAVAQEAEFLISANLVAGDSIGLTVAGTGVIQSFNTNKNTTLTDLATQITSGTSVNATFSGATGKIHLMAKVAGNAFSLSNIVTQSSGVASVVSQPNVVPVAQISSITLPRTIDSGETLTLNIAGSTIIQSYTGSSAATVSAFTAQIDALPTVNATVSGNVVTMTAATPGTPFPIGNLAVSGGTATLVPVQSNIVAVTQVDTLVFPRAFTPGDSLSGSIDGSAVNVSYSGSSDGTLEALAAAIDALPSVTATSNTALKTVTISAQSIGIPFTAGTFAMTTQVPSVVVAGNVAPVAQSESITFPRALVAGDEVSVVVNGSTVTQTYATSSNATITAFAAALNAGGISASASLPSRTITLTANTPGVSFTISNLNVLNQGSPTILRNPANPIKQVVKYQIASTFIAGDTITGTIDGQSVNTSFATDDATTAAALTSQIDGFAGVDAAYESGTRTVTVTAATAGTSFASTSLTVTSSNVAAVSVAANQAEVRANRTITINTVPLDTETVNVGDCIITFATGGNDYDCSDNAASVAIDSGNTDTVAALLRGISGVSDTANGALTPTGSANSVTFTRATAQVGTTAIQFLDGTTGGALSSSANSAQVAVAQSDSFTVPRTLVDGDTIELVIDGATYSQTFLASSDTTASNLASNIDNLPYLSASAVGGTITLVAQTTGNAYTPGNLSLRHVKSGNQTIANDVGATAEQSVTFPSDFVAGDQVDVTVNGNATSTPFATDATTTILNVATAISGVSGVSATASGTNTIVITGNTAGANLVVNQAKVTNSSAATELQANVAAVAQSNSYTIPYALVSGTTVAATVNSTTVSQAFTTDTDTTMTLLAGQIEGVAAVDASFSGASQKLTLKAQSPGTAYTHNVVISGESVSPTNVTPNTASGSQVDSYSFARDLVVGEVLQVTIDGTGMTQNFTTDTATTLAALATQIDALPGVSATPSGSTIVITAAVAGVPFTTSTLTIDMAVANALDTPNVPAQTQIHTVTAPRNIVSGDVLDIDVNSTNVSVSYSGSEADTLTALASGIDALAGVTATSSGLVVTVSAEVAGVPFTIGNLELENTVSGTTTVNNVSAVAQIDGLNLPSFYAGDVVSVSVNGSPLSINFNSDTSTTINDIRSAINGVGPVTATLSGGQLIVTANTPGTPFTMSAMNVTNTQTATIIAVNVPAVAQIVDISANDVIKKWTFRVTVNGTPYDYLSNGTDDATDIATQLSSIVTASGVTATASGPTLTLTANVPGVDFTYAATALDLTAPAITDVVSTSETLRTAAVTTTSLSIDEPGNIYFVLSGSTATTPGQINTLLLAGQAFLGRASATTDTPYTFTIPGGIQDGSYGAISVDAHNNVSGYHTTGLVIDNTAPIVSIATTDNQTVNTSSFFLSGSTEPLLSVSISTTAGTTPVTSIGNGDFSGSVLLAVDSANTITVTATDIAGNVGMSTLHITQDSINPLFTLVPSATVTNQPTVTFSGSTEAGADVGIIGGAAPVHVTAAGDGSFSGTLTLNADSTNSLSVTVTDLASNTYTGSFTVVQDSIVPTVVLSTSSGAIVDAATFQIDGFTEMNANVTIMNQSGTTVGTGVASGTGAFSITATLLQDSINTLTVTATDAANNQSSDALTVTEDSVANTLLISPVAAATNSANINISGTTKIGSTLEITHSGGLTQSGTTSDGNFAFPVTLLANSNNDISVSSQDQAGHVATGSVSVIHDDIVPVVTLGTSDTTTSLTTFTLTGTTEALASITIAGGSGGTVGGVASASGTFSIAVPLAIGGVNALTVTAADLAGNSGTANVSITQDPIPLTLVLNPIGTVVTNAANFTISGTSKSGAIIAVTGSGMANVTASSTGAFTATVTLMANGINNFTVTATDLVGGLLTDSFSVTQDSIAPILTLANSTGATNLLTYTLTGTTESGATLQATGLSGATFTGMITSTASGTGAFSIAIPLVANTGATFQIVAVDAAGNSSSGATLSMTQDNLAPAIGTQNYSGTTVNSVTTGFYNFTTNEATTSTFYVGTASNVLTSLVWSGSTVGLNHSGAVVGIQPNVSYYVFVRAVDGLGNTTDSTVTPVTFHTVSSGAAVPGGSGGGGGGGGGSITIGIGGLITPVSPGGVGTGAITSPVAPPTSQTGTVITTSTGTVVLPPQTSTPVRVPNRPIKKPTTPAMPSMPTTPAKPNTTPSQPPKGVTVTGPGFDYAIVDNNYPTPSTTPVGEDQDPYQPGIRFISASNAVKVRETRNAQSMLVMILPRNSRVLLVEEKNGWGKIQSQGSVGWVGMEYLRTLQDSDLARTDARLFERGYLPEYAVKFQYITAHSLNMRYGPGTDFRSVRQLSQGERVVILDSVGFGWVEVRTARGTGFVQKKWIK